ncbi:MAG: RHS repeat-associated core domain-containing protein, partial [Bacteroidales bacterium]|nr:RHS repeat-associated core domain-containing protein [Bacteroidales bacterium]
NDPLNITGYSQVLKQTETDLVTGEQANITYIIGRNRISQITLKDNTEQDLYFIFDGHGSTRILTDIAGAILELYAFDAYGNAIGFDPSVVLTEFLYSGEQFDSKIGQQYLRARYYDPATGRFNRLDPFFGNLNDPQSLHKYLYTHADPVNGIDPTGKMTTVQVCIAVAAVALTFSATFFVGRMIQTQLASFSFSGGESAVFESAIDKLITSRESYLGYRAFGIDKFMIELKRLVSSGKISFKVNNNMNARTEARYIPKQKRIEYRITADSDILVHELVHAYIDLNSSNQISVQDDEAIAYMFCKLFQIGTFYHFGEIEKQGINSVDAINKWQKIWSSGHPESLIDLLKVNYTYIDNNNKDIDDIATEEQRELMCPILGIQINETGKQNYREAYKQKFGIDLP